MNLFLAGDDGLVVTLDRGFHDPDGGVAGVVDIDSVEKISATGGTVDDGQQGATCRIDSASHDEPKGSVKENEGDQ